MCAFFNSGLGTPVLDGFRDLCSLLLWRDLRSIQPVLVEAAASQAFLGFSSLCCTIPMEMHILDLLQPRVSMLWKPEWVSPTCCKCCLFWFGF